MTSPVRRLVPVTDSNPLLASNVALVILALRKSLGKYPELHCGTARRTGNVANATDRAAETTGPHIANRQVGVGGGIDPERACAIPNGTNAAAAGATVATAGIVDAAPPPPPPPAAMLFTIALLTMVTRCC